MTLQKVRNQPYHWYSREWSEGRCVSLAGPWLVNHFFCLFFNRELKWPNCYWISASRRSTINRHPVTSLLISCEVYLFQPQWLSFIFFLAVPKQVITDSFNLVFSFVRPHPSQPASVIIPPVLLLLHSPEGNKGHFSSIWASIYAQSVLILGQ